MTKFIGALMSAGLLVSSGCGTSTSGEQPATADPAANAPTADTSPTAHGAPELASISTPESTSTTNELTEPLVSFAPVGRPASRTAGDAQSSLDIVLSNIGFESISDARFAPGPTGSRDPWLYVEVNVPP